MAIAVAITGVDNTQNSFIVYGTLTLSGAYGGASTHGDTLSFGGFDLIKSNDVPNSVSIFEAPAAGTSASGYVYGFCPGTTQANGVMQIFGTGAAAGDALQEYTEAASYSGALTGANVKFVATFRSFI